MAQTVVPIRRPKRKPLVDPTLWLANTLIFVLRTIFRVVEFFASGKKRERLRTARAKMEDLNQKRREMLQVVDQSDGDNTMQALEAYLDRSGDAGIKAEFADSFASVHLIRQESDDLQAIVRDAGENKPLAVEGVRAYLETHPKSGLGYSYLGGLLKQIGDLDGSLTAYHKAVGLADGPTAIVDRLQIGLVLQEKGDLSAARAEFCQIIEESAADAGSMVGLTYLYLGNVLEQSGDRVNACIAWKQAIRWDELGHIAPKARKKLDTA